MSLGATTFRTVGRYTLYGPIASGGMATVHFGRLRGDAGFARTVAIKRLHPTLAEDPEFAAMFLDEARLVARIRHPSVVPTLDVVRSGRELFLIMEYIDGESLSRLLRAARTRGEAMPLPVVSAVFAGVLHGLHAAHEARDERGDPLDIVHRDVSPQNVLVGKDGVARVVDFGVAKAVGRCQATTRDGHIKGKVMYLAPELFRGANATRQSDVYSTGVVLWETIAGRPLFVGDHEADVLRAILHGQPDPPSRFVEDVPPEVDAVVLRALDRSPARRFSTARDMAAALERAITPATPSVTGAWVERIAEETLSARAAEVAELESGSLQGSRPFDQEALPDTALASSSSSTDEGVGTLHDVPEGSDAERRVASREARPRTHFGFVAALALVAVSVGAWGVARPHALPATTAVASPSAVSAEGVVEASALPPAPTLPSASATAIVPSPPRPVAPQGHSPRVVHPMPSAAPRRAVRFGDPG
jgi:serine/threonine-protein kinase